MLTRSIKSQDIPIRVKLLQKTSLSNSLRKIHNSVQQFEPNITAEELIQRICALQRIPIYNNGAKVTFSINYKSSSGGDSAKTRSSAKKGNAQEQIKLVFPINSEPVELTEVELTEVELANIFGMYKENISRFPKSSKSSSSVKSKSFAVGEIVVKVEVPGNPFPPFPTCFTLDHDGYDPKTLREMEMIEMSAAIRRKARWYDKMKNPEILEKWRREAQMKNLTPNQVSYVFQELVYYASLRDPTNGSEVSDVEGVWQSDTLIGGPLKNELLRGVEILENIPEGEKDWHPGSNGQVLDLVHPSIYPIIYGQTGILSEDIPREAALKFCGGGNSLEFKKVEDENRLGREVEGYSTKFSWLPSEFMIREDGTVRINSYVNNLHPVHHAGLYGTLEKIFAKFVPLFENVLDGLVVERRNRIEADGDWYAEDSKEDDEDEEDEDEEDEDKRELIIPDAPPDFTPPKKVDPLKKVNLRGTNVQVIVKLANIVLTPENPSYPGGVWHVEGMNNENIVGTGIYYYDVSNIYPSGLGFRTAVCHPQYEQEDRKGVKTVYGFESEDSMNQYLGSVLTSLDRSIAFPNIYQHRVQPFKLMDPTQPGHRKILVFFLVDPGKRITSTLNVPPQQFSWFLEELLKIDPFSKLPLEIVHLILKYLKWPLTMGKAKEARQALMDERKYFIAESTKEIFEREFSFCEH